MLGNARKYGNTYGELGRLTSPDRPDALSRDRKGRRLTQKRGSRIPELTDFPATSPGCGKLRTRHIPETF
jgi:hypothetical protein